MVSEKSSLTPTYELDSGFEERMEELYAAIGDDLQKIAEKIGYSRAQFRKWKTGETKIPALVAAQLCSMGGKSLDWLMFGEGNALASRDVNLEFLSEVIYHFETGIQKFDLELNDPIARAQLIPLMFQYCLETEDEKARDIFQKNMFKVAK